MVLIFLSLTKIQTELKAQTLEQDLSYVSKTVSMELNNITKSIYFLTQKYMVYVVLMLTHYHSRH